MSGAPAWESDRWRRWRARQLGAAALTAGMLASSGQLAWCDTRDCVAAKQDEATTSLLGPTDAPPADPISTWSVMVTGGTASPDQVVTPPTINAPATLPGGAAPWWVT